jgi:hypothetical protein
MSARADLAQRIGEFVEENDLNFFGDSPSQSEDKRYYGMLIGKPRILDGFIRVYSNKFILIQLQGPMASGDYSGVYQSEADAMAFLEALAAYDMETAFAVPTKPRKPIHKAEPAPEFAEDALSTCIHCHREIKRVPGGQGSTWVHADTGAVVA